MADDDAISTEQLRWRALGDILQYKQCLKGEERHAVFRFWRQRNAEASGLLSFGASSRRALQERKSELEESIAMMKAALAVAQEVLTTCQKILACDGDLRIPAAAAIPHVEAELAELVGIMAETILLHFHAASILRLRRDRLGA